MAPNQRVLRAVVMSSLFCSVLWQHFFAYLILPCMSKMPPYYAILGYIWQKLSHNSHHFTHHSKEFMCSISDFQYITVYVVYIGLPLYLSLDLSLSISLSLTVSLLLPYSFFCFPNRKRSISSKERTKRTLTTRISLLKKRCLKWYVRVTDRLKSVLCSEGFY
jgi:hypothetical protein